MKIKVTNITIHNGLGEVFKNQSIIFDEKEIIAINEDVEHYPSVDNIIDGSGLSCLPGMIDMHVHLNLDGTPDISK